VVGIGQKPSRGGAELKSTARYPSGAYRSYCRLVAVVDVEPLDLQR